MSTKEIRMMQGIHAAVRVALSMIQIITTNPLSRYDNFNEGRQIKTGGRKFAGR
jgi:hypothetical protein